ncbi:hypothetical protein HU200_028258 [Digitaria exilis]|uniref:Uncharacterized protein n=1 Tax=Digitaria exilis TaxID=1010633 RepID=A0A835EVW7_9POAL|nr:hypothetical protein HU200_028258 [Digitaria exilis]
MEGAAQSLVANVRQALGDEYRLLSGVGGEVTELRDDLATMNALLRMQSEADEGAMDHFDQEWMKQLRELAYDAEDSVDLYKLRVKCRHGDGMAALWFKMVHLARTLTQRHRLAGDIRDLRARAITISERHARYNIDRKALRSSATFAPVVGLRSMPELRRDKSPDHNNQFVDIGDQAGAFAKRLKEDEHDFKVFAVVGFGGVGKTTLAMEVCQRLAADFPYQAMVSVSQTFQPDRDLEKLLKGILQQVVTPKMDDGKGVKEEKDVGISELGAYLSDKRYLIVIDDVWTTQAWEAIEYKLVTARTNNNCGGRIIVTTRIEAVAEACSTFSTVSGRYIHHMEPLKLEDSKKLFLSKAFGKMDATYPEELKEEMDKILTKCSGIPLAIVSVANILAGYTSKDKWERVCKSMGSEMVAHPSLEGMRHIVGLSYNHLPHELKRCMVYLSIFPEDYEIEKDRLVSRCIAEGLVPEKRGCTLTEVAETYLDELVSRNMVVRRFDEYDMNVEWYRVHDVLLEVMVSKSLESNFVSLLGEQYAGVSYDDRIRRLSIQGSSSSLGIERGMEVKHVRSLSMFQLQEGHKLLDNLDKFVLLRVLDLEGCKGVTDQHVLHACKLYLLRFLSFKGSMDVTDHDLEEIGKLLPRLKFLSLRGCRRIKHLPDSFGGLRQLPTLDVRHTSVVMLPPAIFQIEKLQYIHAGASAWHANDDMLTIVPVVYEKQASTQIENLEGRSMQLVAATSSHAQDDTAPVPPAMDGEHTSTAQQDGHGSSSRQDGDETARIQPAVDRDQTTLPLQEDRHHATSTQGQTDPPLATQKNRTWSSWLGFSKKSKPCASAHNEGVDIPAAAEIGKLTALHTLGVINVNGAGGNKAILKKELNELTQTRKLGVSGINRGNIKDLFSAISGLRHLESLSLRLDEDNFPDGISLPKPVADRVNKTEPVGPIAGRR